MSVHRLLSQDRNRIASAVLSATGTMASEAIRRAQAARTGNGQIALAGPYTGQADATVDVEIVGGAGNKRLTAPVFRGVGSGTLEDLAITGSPAEQTFTLTLLSTGTKTALASTDLEGYRLTAKAAGYPGAAGNALYLSVDQAGVTRTALDAALIADLPAGSESVTGTGWDWGTVYGTADSVPVGARRLQFGDDISTIYIQWKAYQDGEWTYYFLPALKRAFPKGTRVYEVTGSRSCVLSDGAGLSRTYTGVVTLRDLLAKIAADPLAPVTVEALPSEERTPDNLAAILDLRLRTDARVDWTAGEGSEYATGFVNAYAGAGAVTELVTATCYASAAEDDAGLGRERWEVRDLRGKVGTATTGAPYTDATGKYGFTIPTKLPPGYGENRGRIGATTTYASRADGVTPPPICVKDLKLGPNARDGEITFVYTKRPTGTCACENQSYARLTGGDACLDPDITEGSTMGTLAPGYAARLGKLTAWHRDFVEDNTRASTEQSFQTARYDIQVANAARSALGAVLGEIYTSGTLSWALRAPLTVVAKDTICEPSPRNGYRYRCTAAGTTSSGTPTWTTTVGQTTADGTVTWECLGKTPEAAWDTALLQVQGELSVFQDLAQPYPDMTGIPVWTPSTAYSVGQAVRVRRYYNGSSIASPMDGDLGAYETYTVRCVKAGTSVNPASWTWTSGGTGYSYPTFPGPYVTGSALVDPGLSSVRGQVIFEGNDGGSGTAPVWVALGKMKGADAENSASESSGVTKDVTHYISRYAAIADDIRAIAEIVPSFNDASTTGKLAGSACWQDSGDAYWWVPQGGAEGYCPAFTNQYYYSIKYACDGSPDQIGTHEYGFAITVVASCVGSLKEGDTVTIRIGDAGWPATYTKGCVLLMAVVGATPLHLAGGLNGSDTLTWAVAGSVAGALANYSQALAGPALYNQGGVAFRLRAGGVANEVGDRWTFGVEAGAFRYRLNGGAWSAAVGIAPTSIGNGLALTFQDGAAPSFVVGDTATFQVRQPHAVASAILPDDQAFAWSGSSATITAQVTGTVDCLALPFHGLPAGASVAVSGPGLSATLPWRAGPLVLMLPEPLESPTLALTITGATGGWIGWLWAGQALDLLPSVSTAAAAQRRTLEFSLVSGEGMNPTGALAGLGRGFSLSWSGFLAEADVTGLLAAIQAHKALGNRPMCFVPHAEGTGEAELVLPPDALEWGEWSNWQAAGADRCIDLNMELRPWLTAA